MDPIDKAHLLPTHNCPSCGMEITAASGVCEGTPSPKPGDITICIECIALMMFNEDLTVRLVKESELEDIHPSDLRDIRRAQRAIRRAHEQRPN